MRVYFKEYLDGLVGENTDECADALAWHVARDRWVITHTLLPFAFVYVLRLRWHVVLLLAYIFGRVLKRIGEVCNADA